MRALVAVRVVDDARGPAANHLGLERHVVDGRRVELAVEALDLRVPVGVAAVERARGDHPVVLDPVEDRAVEPALLADDLGAAAQHQLDRADGPQLGERPLNRGQALGAALDRVQAHRAREIRDLVRRARDVERVRTGVVLDDAAKLHAARPRGPVSSCGVDLLGGVERGDGVGPEQVAGAVQGGDHACRRDRLGVLRAGRLECGSCLLAAFGRRRHP